MFENELIFKGIIAFILLVCTIMYVDFFIAWRKFIITPSAKENAMIKNLCDDYNENLKKVIK